MYFLHCKYHLLKSCNLSTSGKSANCPIFKKGPLKRGRVIFHSNSWVQNLIYTMNGKLD